MHTNHRMLIGLFLAFFSAHAMAGWQVASGGTAVPQQPFFQAGTADRSVPTAYSSGAFPNQYANLGQPAAVYAVSISGSVKENVERIMSRYKWKVIWKAPYDYNFNGRVTGSSLPNVMEKLLQPFPLQAVMYMSNKTLMVVPRYGVRNQDNA